MEEIEPMGPGPDLDRRIAEKVMGWMAKVEQHPAYITPRPSLAVWTKGYSGRGITEYTTEDHWRHTDWSPSRSIADAWEVVEKLAPLAGDFNAGDGFFHLSYADSADHSRGEGCDPKRTIDDDGDIDHERWSAHFHVGCMAEGPDYPPAWDHGRKFCARGATAPLAICRAALRAVQS